MRRPNRTIEIFSLSALDLFASAMGAFVVVAALLFPYYQRHATVRNERERLTETLRQLETEHGRLAELAGRLRPEVETLRRQADALARLAPRAQEALELERRNAELRRVIAGMEARQRVSFLILRIGWQVNADIDLHVVDPDGNEINFTRHNRNRRHFPGTQAELTFDRQRGPGVEVYLDPQVKPGTYKIFYNLYAYPLGAARVPVEVGGIAIFRNGRQNLPVRTLSSVNASGRVQDGPPVAVLVVAPDGTIRVQ
ncbi:MAG: hypothetical protein L6R19_26650 [Alphaproteobacteria bacterium]|nr:hypothetical protein [Alphaproteobacteria bacterium]